MTDNPSLDGTVPSLQPDHWIATTITTFRQWLITFHCGLNNSTPVDISRSSPATQRIPHRMPSILPATQRISHPMPSMSYPTSRIFHTMQSIQITPAPTQVSVPYQLVSPSFPLDTISSSPDGGEVLHTKWYEDCPSINKSCNPSSVDAVNKSNYSPYTSYHEICHSETQDSICSEYFEAYQQLQHIIANKNCNPDFTFMSDNIANIKNTAQQWGDPSYIKKEQLNKPPCTSTSCNANAAQDTTAHMINLQTIADNDLIHDILSSCYREAIDPNDEENIIIGNNLWGVNSTSAFTAGKSPNQGHDYGEHITIGNKLWEATYTSFLNGETILIDKKL
ncbi:hypothetical protein ACA910_004228 [Epithemia clementina (nom. ined.)]